MKKHLNEKNAAFRENSYKGFKINRKETRAMIQKVIIYFKFKVEDWLANQDVRSAWQSLNKMMWWDLRGVNHTDHFKWVNDLSMFYGRYDV